MICDEADYEWAKFKCDEYRLYGRVANVLFAPSTSELPAGELADWILHDGLNVRLQVQMHKVLWGDVPGR